MLVWMEVRYGLCIYNTPLHPSALSSHWNTWHIVLFPHQHVTHSGAALCSTCKSTCLPAYNRRQRRGCGGCRVFPGSAEENIKAALFALSLHLLLDLFELGGHVSSSRPPATTCPRGAIDWAPTDPHSMGLMPARTYAHTPSRSHARSWNAAALSCVHICNCAIFLITRVIMPCEYDVRLCGSCINSCVSFLILTRHLRHLSFVVSFICQQREKDYSI